MLPLAQNTRFSIRMLQCARSAIDKGADPEQFMDNINAIWCGRGTNFYIDSHGRLCCNTIFKLGHSIFNPATFKVDETLRCHHQLPAGVEFQLNKITVYYSDGHHKVIKDLAEMVP